MLSPVVCVKSGQKGAWEGLLAVTVCDTRHSEIRVLSLCNACIASPMQCLHGCHTSCWSFIAGQMWHASRQWHFIACVHRMRECTGSVSPRHVSATRARFAVVTSSWCYACGGRSGWVRHLECSGAVSQFDMAP